MICRMCVLESKNVFNIFKNGAKKYKIAEMIFLLFRFQPLPDDPISIVICKFCWKQIEIFHAYYLKIEDAQIRLKELRSQTTINNDKTSPMEDNIKTKCEVVSSAENTIEDQNISDNWCEELLAKNADWKSVINFAEDFQFIDEEGILDEYESDNVDASYKSKEVILEEAARLIKPESSIESKTIGTTTQVHDNQSALQNNPIRKKIGRPRKLFLPKVKTERARKLANVDDDIAKMTNIKCDICGEDFGKFSLLQKHCRNVHNIKGYVVCCLKKFYRRIHFYDHLINHVDPNRLKCEKCDKKYVNNKGLRLHMLAYHGSDDIRIFQCDQCPLRFAKDYLLRQHSKTHLEKKAGNVYCKECDKNFSSTGSLYVHRRNIHENAYTYMCDICAKVLRSKIEFEKHKLEHEGISEPMKQCAHCSKWYKNTTLLRRHMKTHNANKDQCVCTICGKISPSLLALKSHMKFVHQPKRFYNCTVCDKVFKKNISLREHMCTHTGGSLYTCPHCPKTFNSSANLHSHRKKVHRKEWEEARLFRNMPPGATK